MRSILLFIILTFTFGISCKSKKAAADDIKDPPGSWILKYQRGPCFGKCPVYDFYILTDRTGLIQVKENLMQPGWYATALDQKEVNDLLKTLEPDQCWHPDLTDQPTISDQPSHHLEYKHRSGLRTLDIQSRYNTELSDLFRSINHLAVESKWQPTDLRPVGTPKGTPLDLIVQLKEDVDVNAWIKKYEASFGATVKKKISPKQTYYIIAKDPDKGSSDAFYQALKKDKDLIGVQFDSQTEKRQ